MKSCWLTELTDLWHRHGRRLRARRARRAPRLHAAPAAEVEVRGTRGVWRGVARGERRVPRRNQLIWPSQNAKKMVNLTRSSLWMFQLFKSSLKCVGIQLMNSDYISIKKDEKCGLWLDWTFQKWRFHQQSMGDSPWKKGNQWMIPRRSMGNGGLFGCEST